jgi:hypothetical protein
MSHDQMVLLRGGLWSFRCQACIQPSALDLEPNYLYVTVVFALNVSKPLHLKNTVSQTKSDLLTYFILPFLIPDSRSKETSRKTFDPPSIVKLVSYFINDGYQITVSTTGNGNPATVIFLDRVEERSNISRLSLADLIQWHLHLLQYR